MVNKRLSERLNQELDKIGVPQSENERLAVFAKILKIPRFKAQALLRGHTKSTDPLIEILANELEVDAEWLIGTNKEQHN